MTGVVVEVLQMFSPLVVTSPGCLTCLCDVYSLTLKDFCQVLQLKLEGCAYFEFDTCTHVCVVRS